MVERNRLRAWSALLVVLAAAVCLSMSGCGQKTRQPLPAHGTYAGMQVVADKYAKLELEQITTGYFGTPLYSTEGARVGSPVPIHSVRVDADVSKPLLSRLETWVDTYAIPVVNVRGEILGDYEIHYSLDPERDTQGWMLWSAGREGALTDDAKAKTMLGLSRDASTTLIDSGTYWSVVASGGVEYGVAPRVILDHNPYASLPEEAKVYEGDALRAWFTPSARGW